MRSSASKEWPAGDGKSIRPTRFSGERGFVCTVRAHASDKNNVCTEEHSRNAFVRTSKRRPAQCRAAGGTHVTSSARRQGRSLRCSGTIGRAFSAFTILIRKSNPGLHSSGDSVSLRRPGRLTTAIRVRGLRRINATNVSTSARSEVSRDLATGRVV